MGDIIDDVIKREDPHDVGPITIVGDRGGLTYKGISSISNPDLFVNGLPSDTQVRQRYLEKYVMGPGFDQVTDQKVKSLLVDWGVTSGPAIAIQGLQSVLGVTVDGVLGPETIGALATVHPEDVVNGLVAKRVKMIARLVAKNPSQIKFLEGWISRAVEWLG